MRCYLTPVRMTNTKKLETVWGKGNLPTLLIGEFMGIYGGEFIGMDEGSLIN